jgi:hypothetical protein
MNNRGINIGYNHKYIFNKANLNRDCKCIKEIEAVFDKLDYQEKLIKIQEEHIADLIEDKMTIFKLLDTKDVTHEEMI